MVVRDRIKEGLGESKTGGGCEIHLGPVDDLHRGERKQKGNVEANQADAYVTFSNIKFGTVNSTFAAAVQQSEAPLDERAFV